MADTRKDKRAPLSLKVRFKSATVDEFIEQYSTDISRGGTFIKSKNPMPVGTLLKFEFQLKNETRLIHGVGRVVWKREPAQAAPDLPAGMGIKFIKMDAESRATVQQIVDARGELPGQFETGGAVGAGTTEASGAQGMFPGGTSEMPPPEDRTQVRHASEFLASALADTEGAAADEARAGAEAARKRTEEIQRAREAAARSASGSGPLPEASPAEARGEEPEVPAPIEEAVAVASAPPVAEPAPEPAESVSPEPELATEEPAAPVLSEPPVPVESRVSGVPSEPPEAVPSELPAAEPKKSNMGMILVFLLLFAGGGYLIAGRLGLLPPGLPGAAATSESETLPEAAPPELPESASEVVAPLPEPAPTPEPEAASVPVKVSSDPEGALIHVDGEDRGRTPLTTELPEGQAAAVTAELEGHAAASQTVTATAAAEPLHFELERLKYVLRVTTEPAGARVKVDRHTAVTPGEIEMSRVRGPLEVTIVRAGYKRLKRELSPQDFTERDGALRYELSATLEENEESASPRPSRPRPRPEESGGAAASGATPAPEKPKEPEKPKPEKAPPPPAEAVPDNPF